MEKKETVRDAAQITEAPSRDEKWMKHREGKRRRTDINADRDTADMDHADFLLFLQEIEHH